MSDPVWERVARFQESNEQDMQEHSENDILEPAICTGILGVAVSISNPLLSWVLLIGGSVWLVVGRVSRRARRVSVAYGAWLGLSVAAFLALKVVIFLQGGGAEEFRLVAATVVALSVAGLLAVWWGDVREKLASRE